MRSKDHHGRSRNHYFLVGGVGWLSVNGGVGVEVRLVGDPGVPAALNFQNFSAVGEIKCYRFGRHRLEGMVV